MRKTILWLSVAVFFLLILLFIIFPIAKKTKNNTASVYHVSQSWICPDTNNLPNNFFGQQIRYGRDLIVHTALFLGPKGSIAQVSNGMNCDNCHIDGGTRIFCNNFSMTSNIYPVFRKRSNRMESLEMRINDCFARSLNGQGPGDSSKEMKALIAYIKWVGKDVKVGTKIEGSATGSLGFLNRAADTLKGKNIFVIQCSRCHGINGQGMLQENGKEYLYPPLWGKHSYNTGAGLYQLSKFAGFIRNNMPFGTTYKNPVLSVEQAWDVAAYVNSKPRPDFKNLQEDWSEISEKPVDYPFGPYTDQFSESQHKYGPYQPIVLFKKSEQLKIKNPF